MCSRRLSKFDLIPIQFLLSSLLLQTNNYKVNLFHFPANIGVLFNLTVLIVQNSNLIEIKAENFLGMQNLEYLDCY